MARSIDRITCSRRTCSEEGSSEGEDIGHGFFLAIIVTQDELEFDTHSGTPPVLSGECRIQAILPEFAAYPQVLHALSETFSKKLRFTRRAGTASSRQISCRSMIQTGRGRQREAC